MIPIGKLNRPRLNSPNGNVFRADVSIQKLIYLYYISEILDQTELQIHCEHAIVSSFSPNSAFDILYECTVLGLNRMIDYVIHYISSNKIAPTMDTLTKFTTYLSVISKVMTQLASLTFPPPPVFSVVTKSLIESLEKMFIDGVSTDCTIWIKNQAIKVHSCLLGIRWEYFSQCLYPLGSEFHHNTKMSYATFHKLIVFFYTGNLKPFNLEDCAWILSCADHYYLRSYDKLIEHSLNVIDKHITKTNWVQAVHLALKSQNQIVEKKALSVMPRSTNPKNVVSLLLSIVKEQQVTVNHIINQKSKRDPPKVPVVNSSQKDSLI